MEQIQLTSNHMIALLPILVISATIVITMLSISWKRNQTLTATITTIGLGFTLLSIIPAIRLINGLPGTSIEVTSLLVLDHYAYFASLSLILVTLACTSFAHIYLEGYKGNRDEFYLLLLLSTLGGMILVSSHHLMSLFIGLELLSLPMYGLVGYSFFQRRSLEASIKYMILSAAGSAFLLFGMALIFADTGHLSFEALTNGFSTKHYLIDLGVVLMIVGLAFKLSLVPFHLWTPDVYEGAPAPASAFLATASKLAIFAMLIRFMEFVPVKESMWISLIITIIAIASILVGNLLALFQNSLKRIMGYSSIAHFGYLLIILLADNEIAAKTATIYLFTYIATTMGAFSVVTVLSSPCQERDADALYRYRGLFWRRPVLTISLSVMMLSLAGVPLTAGFIGKFWLLSTAVHSNLWLLTAMVIVGSAIGLYYYLRVMITLYLAEPGTQIQVNEEKNIHWTHRTATFTLLAIAVIVIFVGVWPSPLIAIADYAGVPSTLYLTR